jgi:hypothetical protein
VIALVACAGPQPKGVEQQLAYAYGLHTSVMTAAANALDAKEISSKDAEHILKVADDTKVILDTAKAAVGAGDIQSAEGQLKLAETLLQELLDYLRARRSP